VFVVFVVEIRLEFGEVTFEFVDVAVCSSETGFFVCEFRDGVSFNFEIVFVGAGV